MKLSQLQEQLLFENSILIDEDAIHYFNEFTIILEKFGQGLLHKGRDDFNPHEETFIRYLSKTVEDLGGNIPKHKLGIFQKVLLSLMAPILGIHFSVNLGTVKPEDIAYVLHKLDKKQIEQISKKIKDFVVTVKHKKDGI